MFRINLDFNLGLENSKADGFIVFRKLCGIKISLPYIIILLFYLLTKLFLSKKQQTDIDHWHLITFVIREHQMLAFTDKKLEVVTEKMLQSYCAMSTFFNLLKI